MGSCVIASSAREEAICGEEEATLAAFVFLGVNDIDILASEPDVVIKTLAVAVGEMNEESSAAWIKENSQSKKQRKRKEN